MPGDPPKYVHPEDSQDFKDPDPSMVSEIRHKLAIRERKMRDEERAHEPS